MNYAKPDMPFPAALDVISLNYQGEGIRHDGAYAGLKGITHPAAVRAPSTGSSRTKSSSAAKTRPRSAAAEMYLLPGLPQESAPRSIDGTGRRLQDTPRQRLRTLHRTHFGSSPDKVFAAEDRHPFVGGRLRLDWMGLPRRAVTLLLVAQFLLRDHRPGRVQEGSLLPLPVALAAGPADGPHPAALDLAGTGRAGHAGARLHLRR